MKIDCEIIKDLLPLYHDEAVSEKTAEAVKEHLEGCTGCKDEYEKISATLPVQKGEKTTGEKFARFMKRHRIKQAILVGVLIISLILGGWFSLNVPVIDVPFEHFGEVKAYRYEDEYGHKKFCVIYSSPEYSFSTNIKYANIKHAEAPMNQFVTAGVQAEGGVLKAFERTPIIRGFKKDTVHETICTFEAENFYGDYSKLIFGGKTVWSLEENADDPVPEYVYYYDKLKKNCRQTGNGYTWIMDYEKNIIGGATDGGEVIYWNFEGERIDIEDSFD